MVSEEASAALLGALPFADREDFEAASRGFIGSLPGGRVGGDGRPVWSIERYALQRGDPYLHQSLGGGIHAMPFTTISSLNFGTTSYAALSSTGDQRRWTRLAC